MKPWLLRQLVALGHFDTVMRESRGDFKSYIRSEPPIFREMVNRLTPRISKHHAAVTVSPYSVCTEAARAPYDFHRKLAETAR